MSLRPANSEEIGKWEQWLWQSHGLQTLPGGLPYFCEFDGPMLLVRWRTLRKFAMRLERRSFQPMMTFQVDGDVHTVAEFWSDLTSGRMPFTLKSQVDLLSRRLTEDAGKGLVWWGIEYPPDSAATTTFLRWFPENFDLPSGLKAEFQDVPVSVPLQTSLNLV